MFLLNLLLSNSSTFLIQNSVAAGKDRDSQIYLIDSRGCWCCSSSGPVAVAAPFLINSEGQTTPFMKTILSQPPFCDAGCQGKQLCWCCCNCFWYLYLLLGEQSELLIYIWTLWRFASINRVKRAHMIF